MRLVKSVCTTLMFPQSRKDIEAFRRTVGFLAGRGVRCMEFYFDGPGADGVGAALRGGSMDAVFIAVIPSKESKLWLCDTEEANRRAAVELFKGKLDYAQGQGMTQLMINSGRAGPDVERGLAALEASVAELFDYAASRNYRLRLLMEPCDENLEAFHLIGPYQRARAFVQKLRGRGYPLELTMDAAHSVEGGEDFVEAVKAVRDFCRHVHFANCDITNRENPLFGDKHLGYEYPDTEWPPAALAGLFAELEKIYPGDSELRIGLEVLCRESDPCAYFDNTLKLLPFWK